MKEKEVKKLKDKIEDIFKKKFGTSTYGYIYNSILQGASSDDVYAEVQREVDIIWDDIKKGDYP